METNYHQNYHQYVKGLNSKPDKAMFEPKSEIPYWIVYQRYSDGSQKVICSTRSNFQAVRICLNDTDRFVRQIGGE